MMESRLTTVISFTWESNLHLFSAISPPWDFFSDTSLTLREMAAHQSPAYFGEQQMLIASFNFKEPMTWLMTVTLLLLLLTETATTNRVPQLLLPLLLLSLLLLQLLLLKLYRTDDMTDDLWPGGSTRWSHLSAYLSHRPLSWDSFKLLSLFQRKLFHQMCNLNLVFYSQKPISQVNYKVTFQSSIWG